MRVDLPDVNVWVALAWPEHEHHARAVHWWQRESNDGVRFCRLTQLGAVRVLVRASRLGGPPMSLGEAWRRIELLRALPEVSLIEDSPAADAVLGQWIGDQRVSPRLLSDAYLAALASVSRARLVTFDRDLLAFSTPTGTLLLQA